MRRWRNNRDETDKDIDISPLIDVVFILLIFFMVATTFAPMPGLRVQLPPPGKPNPNKPKGLIIRVANPDPGQYQGTMMLNEDVVQFDDLFNMLVNKPDEIKSMLIIQSERDVMHEQVVRVMDVAKQSGIVKIGFAVVARE